MPCDYRKYPPNWKTEIRPRILARAGNKCEFCGIENGTLVVRRSNKSQTLPIIVAFFHDIGNYVKIVLTIAHLDHNAENWEVNDARLAALCQRCHNNYDKDFRKANRKNKQKAGK